MFIDMHRENSINILIADDHELYIDGLKGFFDNNDIYRIMGEAYNGEQLVRLAKELKPHIILTDLRMPLLNGAKAIKEIVQVLPEVKCVVLTNYENDLSIIEALEAGAKGYITKNMPKKELFTALDQVSRGYPYFCMTTNAKMVRLLGKSRFNPYFTQQQAEFNDQERKIIHRICKEKTNREIAEELFLSIRTVENNRARIYKKMEVKTSAGVAVYAIKHAMLATDEFI